MKKLKSDLLFIRESLKKFKTQGALFPSSKFLGAAMLKSVTAKNGIVVVELGAGTGVFTKQIITRLPKNGKLIVVEINHNQVKHLREIISDKRVEIIEGDAANLCSIIGSMGLIEVDYVISGLPLGNFRKNTVNKILSEIHQCLKDDGLYIQFQYLLADWFKVKKMFKAKIACYELRNLPPAFVYHCQKKYNELPRSKLTGHSPRFQ